MHLDTLTVPSGKRFNMCCPHNCLDMSYLKLILRWILLQWKLGFSGLQCEILLKRRHCDPILRKLFCFPQAFTTSQLRDVLCATATTRHAKTSTAQSTLMRPSNMSNKMMNIKITKPGCFYQCVLYITWVWDTSLCTCVIRTQIDTNSWGTGRNCKYGTMESDYQHTSDCLMSPCSTKPLVANIALRWLVSISPSASTTSAPTSTGILSLVIP